MKAEHSYMHSYEQFLTAVHYICFDVHTQHTYCVYDYMYLCIQLLGDFPKMIIYGEWNVIARALMLNLRAFAVGC